MAPLGAATRGERRSNRPFGGFAQCIIGAFAGPNASRMHKPLLVAALAIATAGCGILYKQPIYQGNLLEKTQVDQLQTGMSKQQVEALIGSPSIADPFHHDRWDYAATERTGRRGHTQVKNMTLYFENDQLAKWEGEYFPEQDNALSLGVLRKFGPNLAKDDKKKR